MSSQYFHYTQMDNESDGPSFSPDGTESNCGHHMLERASCSPIHQAFHAASAVPPELLRSVFLPEDWPAGVPSQTRRSATVAQFDSPLLPQTLPSHAFPISSHATDHFSPHFGYNMSSNAYPLIPEDHLQTVAMPTPTGHAQYDGGLMGAHNYDPSFGFVHGNYTVEDPPVIPPPIIPMPIVQTYFGAGASSSVDPFLPPLPQSPCYPTTSHQHASPPDSTLGGSPSGGFDFSSYSSSSSPAVNHTLVPSPSEMSDQTQPQSITTASLNQRHTITVPIEAIEFPPVANVWELPFFVCSWEDCGMWINCGHEAVKDHLARIHDVLLKEKTDDPICCKWVDCSSSSKRSGMVRHLRTHFRLRWSCSACKLTYARPDIVRSHSSKGSRCKQARAVSYPSDIAYRARVNGNDTVTLTKMLQP